MISLKNQYEIEKLKKTGNILFEITTSIKDFICKDLPTDELDRFAQKKISQKNAISAFKGYKNYPATLCISINEEVVHGLPSKNKIIKEGDIISIDCGIIYDGYFADRAFSIIVGKSTDEKERLVKVAKECLYLGIQKCRPNNKVGDISYTIQSWAEQNNFSVVRDFVGHGIGFQLHEPPEIPNFGKPDTGIVLKEGLVICLEPMINLGTYEIEIEKDGWTVVTKDRKPSAHFEEMIVITQNGPIILTAN